MTIPEGTCFRCAELARALGKHPNTLRKYESWGFISEVPRDGNGWRRYSRRHALQAAFASTALSCAFEDWRGRNLVKDMIALVREGNVQGARTLLAEHRGILEDALEGALAAKGILGRWKPHDAPSSLVMRAAAAAACKVAPDTLRDWERNGLVKPRRLPNGRRVYSNADLDRLRIVRMLRRAGYSHMGILHLLEGKTALSDLRFARDRWDRNLRLFIQDCGTLGLLLDDPALSA